MDRWTRLEAWESAQRFPFTRVQAMQAGWTAVEIAARVRSGQWHRLVRGAFVLRSVWEALNEDDQHLCVVTGRLLQLRPGWHAAQGSAVLAHGLPFLGKRPVRPQLVCAPANTRVNATSAHERLAALPAQDRAVARGIPVTSPARTAVDRARTRPLREALVIADAVLRSGTTRAQILEVASRCATWPGGRRAGEVAVLADGRSESVLESLSRAGFVEAALPAPELQVEIWLDGRFVARVDFLWEWANLIGEADGRGKYGTVDDLLAEKRRELALRDLGFEVVRWDWDEAFRHPELLADRVRAGLARGARLQPVPGVRLMRTRSAPAAA